MDVAVCHLTMAAKFCKWKKSFFERDTNRILKELKRQVIPVFRLEEGILFIAGGGGRVMAD